MSFIKKERRENIEWLSLNRPEVHNAFNSEFILELTKIFEDFRSDKDLRAVVLKGEGRSFCAGADLNWMKSMKDYTLDENYEDSMALSNMFATINTCPVPTVLRLHGAALGGGVGLVSVCDYVLALSNVKLGFTEVHLGLIPAVIGPFVIEKIGLSYSRALFLSGEKFNAQRAMSMGLVHQVFDSIESLDKKIEELLLQIKSTGPQASRKAKALIWDNIKYRDNYNFLRSHTAKMIASQRISDEGQEGMKALLEKRKPNWNE